MAKRDKVRRPLGAHDAGHLGHRQNVALADSAALDQSQRLGRHQDSGPSGGGALGVGLGPDVNHASSAGLVEVGERGGWGGGHRRTMGRERRSAVPERRAPVRKRWAASSAVARLGAVANWAPIFIPRFRSLAVTRTGAEAGVSAAARLARLSLCGWLGRSGFWRPSLRRHRRTPVNLRFAGARRPLVVRRRRRRAVCRALSALRQALVHHCASASRISPRRRSGDRSS